MGRGQGVDDRFWKRKPLNEMSRREWEALCDGCGKCCVHKLEDEDDGTIYYTNVACRLMDPESCRCTDYENRRQRVPECVCLTPESVDTMTWLPDSCAYRLLALGKDLPDWHPLVSGDPYSVHTCGRSVRHRTISEAVAGELETHIVGSA